jgi:hypothetical protein
MNDISALMATDPLQLSKDPTARRKIIEYYRAMRAQFISGPAPKPAKPKKEKISLDDLDLGAGGKPKVNLDDLDI